MLEHHYYSGGGGNEDDASEQHHLLRSLQEYDGGELETNLTISPEAAFFLFMVLTIIVGVGCVIRLYFVDKVCLVHAAFTLGIVVPITIAAAKYCQYKDQHDQQEIAETWKMVMIFIPIFMGFVFFIPCLKYLGSEHNDSRHFLFWSSMCASFFLLIPGLLLLAMYFRNLGNLASYDYEGPMYLLDFAIDTKRFDERSCGEYCQIPAYNKYYGTIKVGWGHDWACPTATATATASSSSNDVAVTTTTSSTGTKWCQAWVSIPDCEYCEPVGRAPHCQAGYASTAEFCIRNKEPYNLLYWEDVLNWPLKEPSAVVDFTKDPNNIQQDSILSWPVGDFYGNCQSCTAVQGQSIREERNFVQNLKLAGITLSCIGGGIVVVILGILGWKGFVSPLFLPRDSRKRKHVVEDHHIVIVEEKGQQNEVLDVDPEIDEHPYGESDDEEEEEEDEAEVSTVSAILHLVSFTIFYTLVMYF